MNAATLLLAVLPTADPVPLAPEIPAAARPTHYPRQVFDLSPDGKTALTSMHLGHHEQYLRLWDVETGAVVGDLPLGTADVVGSARFAPDGRTVAVALGPHPGGHRVRLLDVRGGRAGREFGGFEGHVRVRGFSPDGTKLVTLDHPAPGWGKAFKPRLETWDVATGKRLDTAEGALDDRLSAATPDGKTTLARADDGSFVVTRAGGKPVTLRADRDFMLYSGAFLTPDGKRAVVGTYAWGTVYDTATGEAVRTLRNDTQEITSVAAADGGRLLFVAVSTSRYSRGPDPEAGWVYVWDLTKPELRTVVPVAGDLWTVQPTADGKRFTAVGGYPHDVTSVEVWDTAGGKRLHAFDVPAKGRTGWAAVSPDGNWVAYTYPGAGVATAVRVWHTGTGKPAAAVQKADAPFAVSIGFTPDSKRIVTLTPTGYAEWDVATGKKEVGWPRGKAGDELRWVLGGFAAAVPGGSALTVSPTAKRRQSYALNLVTEKKEWHLGEVWDHASPPAVSADGRQLALVAGGPRDRPHAVLLRLDDGGSPELARKPDGYVGPVLDGDRVPAWRAWDVGASEMAVAFSPDGKRLYTGGTGHALQVWDTETRQLKATLYAVPAAKPGDPPADWVAFTPAGHFAGTPRGSAFLRVSDAVPVLGFRVPVGPSRAATLDDPLFDPAKVRAALGAK